eukprot:3675334-Ditylum_brightwellii.AAC.1
MSLGHRDIVQNVAKIKNAVHLLIDSRASHTLSFHANQQDGNDAVDSSPPIVTSPTNLHDPDKNDDGEDAV